MLPKKNGRNFSSGSWSPDGLIRAGYEPDGEFKFCGVEPEPIGAYDRETGKFDDTKIVGWSYPVVQDWTNPDTGEIFKQNQLLVDIDDPDQLDVKFGDILKFDKLGGFYSKKSKRYRAMAKKVEKVK